MYKIQVCMENNDILVFKYIAWITSLPELPDDLHTIVMSYLILPYTMIRMTLAQLMSNINFICW